MFYNCMRIISRVIDICSWCTEVITSSQCSVCRGDVSDITPHSATPVTVRLPDTRYCKMFCTEYCTLLSCVKLNLWYAIMQVDNYFASSPTILILLSSSRLKVASCAAELSQYVSGTVVSRDCSYFILHQIFSFTKVHTFWLLFRIGQSVAHL